MATARTRVKPLIDQTTDIPELDPITINLDDPTQPSENTKFENGVLKVEHPDGSVTVDFNPNMSKYNGKKDNSFDTNIADVVDESRLSEIAEQLITGMELDEASRKDWLETRAKAIVLLGLKIEEPRGDVGTTSAPLEGMSTVRHPLLLEATTRFQAAARGELLPASGPVKVRNDSPSPPEGSPPDPDGDLDELAEALEKDMNHFLTSTAKEYVPDTDRMLFYVGFGGDGFKKVYHCPLRRRPVSESVDAENIIISNSSTDIANCGRVTHKIAMRPSTLRRMQLLGSYRDVSLDLPSSYETPNPVQLQKEEIEGIKNRPYRPQDKDYDVREIYTELDLDEFAPKQFKSKGLPLPYRVTLEKNSRQVLEIKRNWDEEDPQCLPKQFFVQYPFIRGLNFYGLGFIHLLGNTTLTLTAAWRLMLDNGMFANFPGFIYAKAAGRQNTNQFRVPPGGGIPFELPANAKLSDVVAPVPYKETGQAFTGFIQHVEEIGERLGMIADINVGEGKQNAPVGTTLALLEQATMVIDSAFKRLHAAQVEEFALLKERFREDPEALWRHNKKPTLQWQKDQVLRALEHCELVPVSDPNNPTSLHRMQKVNLVKMLQSQNPSLYNARAVDERIYNLANVNSDGLFNDQPQQPQPDPKIIQAQMRHQSDMMKAQTDARIAQMELQLKQEDMRRQSLHDNARAQAEFKIEQMKLQLAKEKLLQEAIIHTQNLLQDHALANQVQMNDTSNGMNSKGLQ